MKSVTSRGVGLSYSLITTGIIAAVLIETYAHCVLLYKYEKDWVAVIYLVAGLLVGVLPFTCRNQPVLHASKIYTYFTWAGLLVIFYLLFQDFPSLLAANPLDYKKADMLPIMEVMSGRFMNGQHVYDKIPEIWQGMQPIYLPAMWMPFIISTLLDLDPRWITLSFILMGVLVTMNVWDTKPRPLISMIVLLPVFWIITAFITRDTNFLVHTQEGVVIGYYLIFAYALTRDNPYFVGFAAALCLMSRFSLIFWLLAFGCFLLFSKDYKYLIKAASTCIGTVCILLVATGAIYHLDVFLGLQQTYLNAIRPNNEWKYAGLIDNELGIARFWGYENLKQLHRVFLLVNILTPIAIFGIYILRRRSIGRVLLALCTLKLSLVLFYNLIIIPAGYLFYTSTFFSLAILYYWLIRGNLQAGRSELLTVVFDSKQSPGQ
ncbi:MAG TPA: hypothetical protein VI603_17850 [Saprospiraceae bacterium]|nr:hypothetical protein [Saprospiraceae bacterium]